MPFGLLFLVPLGDGLNRKYVVLTQLLLSVAALVVAGLSPNIAILLGAMLIVGLMAVVVQFDGGVGGGYWRRRQKRGQAVGTLTSGIVFSGISVISFFLYQGRSLISPAGEPFISRLPV